MKNTVENNVSHKICTGCASCMNICPADAILMWENGEGFLMPHVDNGKCLDCGKCVEICPVLHPSYANNPNPDCYAFRASDDIRDLSSSGGVFPVLARHILDEEGYVAGAVYDAGARRIRHILGNSQDAVAKMRGSKYVQSDINHVYRQIRELLAAGKKALFTGAPCQVAGLYAFLGKSCDSLFTADIVCHGVPSQKILNMHLDEIGQNREIINIRSRLHSLFNKVWICAIFTIDSAERTVIS